MVTKTGRRGGNKSAAIREYLQTNPAAGPTEVVNALAEKKVTVTPTLVSNVKARLEKGLTGRKPGRPGRKPRSLGGSVSVAALVEAKRFADQVGSVQVAQEALATLSRLR
jgi:hypothetical protein